jgi:transposase
MEVCHALGMGRTAIQPKLNRLEKLAMERLLTGNKLDHRQGIRLQIVLNRTEGKRTHDIASTLKIRERTVSEVVSRFNAGGLQALLQQPPKKPGLRPVSVDTESEICRIVKQEKPKGATHWSTRELAKRVGISHTKVHQILRKHRLKPHLAKRFRTSEDLQFRRKLEDIIGLYLAPPENAIVLCVDEKSQIQALERTQPILPVREGLPERQTHDYWRPGATTLFTALEVASGMVSGDSRDRHRVQEYIQFLKLLNRRCPKKKILHLIVDNVSSHKTKEVQDYLSSRGERFVIHYTPTHSSWLNLIGRWVAEITSKRIRRGSWSSLKELKAAIMNYIHHWNDSGRTFIWTKTAGQVLVAVKKASTI